MDLIVKDFSEINIERPQMVAKLIVTLEEGMQKALLHNQLSGLAACAKQIINLAGLGADRQLQLRRKEKFIKLLLFLFKPDQFLSPLVLPEREWTQNQQVQYLVSTLI